MFINDLFNDKNKTLNEVSNELLGRYKKAAGADASAADKRGDIERGNKRFSGIVKATKKQLAHDVAGHKKSDVNEQTPQYTPKGVPLKQPTAQAPVNVPQGWQATTQPDGSTRISKQGSMSSAEYKQNMADYKAKNWTPEKIADYGQRMASGQGYTDAERQANLQQQQQHFGKYADTGDLKETEPTSNQPRTTMSDERKAQLRKDIDTVDYTKQQQPPAAPSREQKAGIRQAVSDYKEKEKVKEQDVSEEESEQESQRRRYPNYYKHKDTGTVFRVQSPDGTSRDITPDNTEEWDDYYRQQFPDLNTPNDGGFWNADNTAALVEQGVAEGFLGDREYNRVLPFVKRIAGEVSDYDRDEFGEELWSLLDQKYGSKFAQSVLQDSLDFYWDEYAELTGQQGVAEGGFDIPEIPRAPQPRPEPKNKAVGEGSGRNRGYEPGFASPHAPSLGGRRDRDEPDAVNNIEISINGRVWKIFAGKGPDSSKEFFQQKQAVDSMCKRKTAETGKKWSWGVTGAAATNEGTKCNMTEQGRACPEHDIMECPGYSRLMSEAFKMPKKSVQDRMHQHHQELRKKSGLPDPKYYQELKSTFDLPDKERFAKAAELKKKYKVNEARKAEANFDIEDLKRLEQIRDLPTLKAQAMALISKPSEKPMKPEKVAWFDAALDRMDSRIAIIKLMYDLLLSGEGHQVIGSKRSMNPNSYRSRFGESIVANEDVERYVEELGRAGYEIVNERRMTCPECGGAAYSDQMLAEKQDACYHKVKSRYKVWPSAYASGALVRCRKKGAANWGNKSKE